MELRSRKQALGDESENTNGNLAQYTTLLDSVNVSCYQCNILNKYTWTSCFKMLNDTTINWHHNNNLHNYSKLNPNNPKNFVNFRSSGRLTFCLPIVYKICAT